MTLKMLRYSSIFLAAMATLAIAIPVVVESLDKPPPGWEEVSSPAPGRLIKLSIGLQPEDHGLFERTLYEISDPSHANYGRHLSRDAAKALLNPSTAATASVKRWLSDAGIADHEVRDDGQWMHILTTVGQAESLLSTRFGVYGRGDEHVVRTLEYSVPKEIRDHIETIHPTTFFHDIKKSGRLKRFARDLVKKEPIEARSGRYRGSGSGNSVDLGQCKAELTPACLRKLYKMPVNNYPSAHRKSLYGIVGFSGQTAQYGELEEFLLRFAPGQQGATFSESFANGGQNPQGNNYPSGEANGNIQYAVSLTDEIPVRFISVGGENHNFNTDLDLYDSTVVAIEPYLELTTYLVKLEDKKLPQTISISYGVNEQHVPRGYARQVCNMFGQLGTRGVSVLVAAGNLGPGVSCQSNDGANKTKFLPGFPASCPYVTSVGGTEGNSPEVAWHYSSGGFSEYFSRPYWQDDTVSKYLSNYGAKWKGYYNPNGRAYPDVAALAVGHQIMNHGVQETSGGTSSASPVFGAIIALINNERLKKGKSPMGFLNPWIYQNARSGFNDIIQGKSVGCEGTSLWGLPSPVIPNAGWDAVKGWDPVTGWGTPLFDKLRRLADC
ncbi:peptidase S8/S53 domain-containing protein [Dactylonectria macrodidyma]|uniref:tripeptidyl-peptidase II n=1 Tax=Dactylonectria macrodidyma TaxID=307937 RepID=A0A9P9EZI4_9HYPO|nr:peptidase S8/S53 domain-containing protein [Dactylonectria macrodidyma]